MKAMKCYLVFTSFLYKIAVFLGIPLILTGISLWIGRELGMAGILPAVLMLPLAETLSDFWLFGGIQTKDPARMDYLRVSCRGMNIMRTALFMDLIRKLFSCMVTLALGCGGIWLEMKWIGGGMAERSDAFLKELLGGGDGNKAGLFLYLTVMSYFFSVLGTFLSRYGNMLWSNLGIGYIMMLLGMFALFFLLWPEYVFIYLLLFAVLGLAVSVLTVRTGMKKIRRGYYE